METVMYSKPLIRAAIATLLLAAPACAQDARGPAGFPGAETASQQSGGNAEQGFAALVSAPRQGARFSHSPFGLHAAGGRTEYIRELNAQYIRKIVLWDEAEPRPGQYRIAQADRYVQSVQAVGLDLVITLRPVSRWG